MSAPARIPEPTLADIEAARTRLAGRIRRTPTIEALGWRTPPAAGARTFLKLESLQVTGSFKARGALNKTLRLPPAVAARGLVTASSGNHGLGVAYAAATARVPATVYVPIRTPQEKTRKLAAWGAKVVAVGDVWDDANRAALEAADRDGLAYVHPFADADVVAAQGTLALELLEDAPRTDVIVVAIGGGGLCAGVCLAAKAVRPDVRIIGVEPVGAPTLHESLRAGRVVELEKVTTDAKSLAPRRSDPFNFEIVRRCVERVVLVDDAEMRAAAEGLWFEAGIAAELSGAAALAALAARKYVPAAGSAVCAIVCGAGTDGLGGTAAAPA